MKQKRIYKVTTIKEDPDIMEIKDLYNKLHGEDIL